MIILIHSSKTMRPAANNAVQTQQPALLHRTRTLDIALKKLTTDEVAQLMHLSDTLAAKTQSLIEDWSDEPSRQRAAIDSFLGDIYSGLQVQSWSKADRADANKRLRILSGLYGIIRPLDGIYPYRLEMGYKLQIDSFNNLYQYWGNAIANTLPPSQTIINLAAVEYSKVVTKYIDPERIITPVFLTLNPKTHTPTFVAVHSKIARGAFAGWLIKHRIDSPETLKEFAELGYAYSPTLSNPEKPVFVCDSFKGLGLSVRLT